MVAAAGVGALPVSGLAGLKRGGTTFARLSGIATAQRIAFPPAHDICPELHTGRLFWGAELRRATFRDDGGIQGQQIGRCNHPAAALRSRHLEGHPNWVKLARHSSSGTPLPIKKMKKMKIATAKNRPIQSPAWPRHEVLLRFDLTLHRLTSQNYFFKKWIPRFFILRGSRLYYSNGKGGYPDSLEGSLAFMRSNPQLDGRHCIDLTGKRAPPSVPCN